MWGFSPFCEPPSNVLARTARPPRSQSPRSWLSVCAFARSSLLFRILVSPSVFAPSPRHPPSFGCRAKSSSASADLPRPRPLSPRFNLSVSLCIYPSYVGLFGASVLPPLGWSFWGSVRSCPLRSGYRGAPSRGVPFGRNPLLGRSASPCRFALCRHVVASLLLRRNFVVPPLSLRSAPHWLWATPCGRYRFVDRAATGRGCLQMERVGKIWKFHFFFLQLRNNLKIYCLCMFLSRFLSSFSAGCGCCWRWSPCCYLSVCGLVKARLTRF